MNLLEERNYQCSPCCGHCHRGVEGFCVGRYYHLWCWVKKFILRMRDPYEGLSDWTDDFGGGSQ